MITRIGFRDARPQDAVEIVRLLIRTKQESLPHLTDAHDRDFDFWHDRWFRYINDGSNAQKALCDSFTLLGEAAGELVGFAAYHHTRRWDCDAEIESMYVLPGRQNGGLGGTLLCMIVQRLRAEGSHSLCVGYDPRNPYKRFYLKCGAVEVNPHRALWRSLPEISI